MKVYSAKTKDNTLSIVTDSNSVFNAHFDEISSVKLDKSCFIVFLNDGNVAKFEVPKLGARLFLSQLEKAIFQYGIYMKKRRSFRGQFTPCDGRYLDQLKEWGIRV